MNWNYGQKHLHNQILISVDKIFDKMSKKIKKFDVRTYVRYCTYVNTSLCNNRLRWRHCHNKCQTLMKIEITKKRKKICVNSHSDDFLEAGRSLYKKEEVNRERLSAN